MFANLIRAFIAASVVLAPAGAPAQSYPTKPIRLIVPFSPGGTNDILGRMVATHLSETLGQNMIVDNRTGFQGIIGTDLAAKAAPDGYTLVMISSAYTMNPVVYKMPYDTLKALEFVAKIGASFLVVSVGPLLPVNSVKDLLAAAQRKPGEIVFTSSGGFMHFATALFQSATNRKFNIVLYKGGFPAMIDVIGGQAHANLAVALAEQGRISDAIREVESARLLALARGRTDAVAKLEGLLMAYRERR